MTTTEIIQTPTIRKVAFLDARTWNWAYSQEHEGIQVSAHDMLILTLDAVRDCDPPERIMTAFALLYSELWLESDRTVRALPVSADQPLPEAKRIR